MPFYIRLCWYFQELHFSQSISYREHLKHDNVTNFVQTKISNYCFCSTLSYLQVKWLAVWHPQLGMCQTRFPGQPIKSIQDAFNHSKNVLHWSASSIVLFLSKMQFNVDRLIFNAERALLVKTSKWHVATLLFFCIRIHVRFYPNILMLYFLNPEWVFIIGYGFILDASTSFLSH